MTSTTAPSTVSAARSRVMLQLLGTAQGDPVVAQSLRMMLWQAYGEADYPCGSSEEGMFLWWDGQQQALVN